MTAFLKIDNCQACCRALPWEWIPVVLLNGKALPGTGVWRSQLVDGRCNSCIATLEANRQKESRALQLHRDLMRLLGGKKPCREFTFERFEVSAQNQRAFERCKGFDASSENLYLWGSCGVGKTHLAFACARRCFIETLSVEISLVGQLSRQIRMRDPQDEQAALDALTSADVLVLDGLGSGTDTAFTRQLLQEIIDTRDFNDRGGLVITSKYSLSGLANKLGDDSIPSRLAGICSVIEIKGPDYRLNRRLVM